MGFFEYFSKSQLEQIHEATLTIMETTGLVFAYAPARDVFARAGCKIDGHRVFFPKKLVEEQIKKAPAQFTLYARNPEKNVVIGGDHIAFMPCYGAPFVNDMDKGRRQGTLEDFNNFAKLACKIPYMDITGGMMTEPNDIPIAHRNAERINSSMIFSDKPFMGAGTGAKDAEQTIEMASIVFGSREQMAEKPPFVSILCSLTPLGYDDKMCGGIMAYAKAGMPQLISSLTIAGATGPVTMEGTLVVQNAEILAGIALTQLVREGTPVIFAGSSSAAAMRYGTLSIGAPEMAVNTAATAQMGRFYNLPVRGGGALTDSKTVDSQAAYESMMSMMMATMSGINFVLHSAGILEGYITASYEKFIIDSEICGMCRRIKRGEDITTEKLALDVIRQVGPGGEYLTNLHTFKHFKQELYAPILEERDNFSSWTTKGSLTMEQRANAKYKELLNTYEEPDMDKAVRKDLDAYMLRIRTA
ncbi:MAG: trimethylamine methyltransferase family protein [Proteobacteria bacterium]|nr:trimethylamine methyltransferase family protein [Pseudomonadota bacterium]MBU1583636.1 trimethylamine methyltransferase family protein [Pseudomonadota bacterium]MBU2453846.1 trimethylamine methyltransferase family protein [Pseudomonadota bacterium]MBU2629549.1 trimethylamine methyltransferase family protein [Pseudomonadota bacterium]